ncbi:asparaginase [Coprinopsis sp. MPI-PUGE-AT-0042]|nr:asparaginase [Coprinopsis sp. MPI-PUGE-AT-0042]
MEVPESPLSPTYGGRFPLTAYVAVHAGAGVHQPSTEKQVKFVMKEACIKALNLSSTNKDPDSSRCTALDMAESAIQLLEDNPYLNAGLGSNLTLDGTVECDAAIMEGASMGFGSVGAASEIRNPITVAKEILEYSKMKDKLGRVPPLTLVSAGATSFARSQGLTTILPVSLVTPDAQRQWKKWKERLESSSADATNGALTEEEQAEMHGTQDTVGAVAWDPLTGGAAGVSSGGLLLKWPGRVGEAAVYGAGCWAQQDIVAGQDIGVACSVSGTGELIIRAQLARSIGEQVLSAMKMRAEDSEVIPSSGKDQDEDHSLDQFLEDDDEECLLEDDPLDTHSILQRILEREFWRECVSRKGYSIDYETS